MNTSEKSLRSFFNGLFHEVTTLDGKFLKTLMLMLRKPGEVSHHYMNGKRVPFYKPASMFFVANLLYFLFPSINALNSGLYVQMNRLPHSRLAAEMVSERLAQTHMTLEEFTPLFDQQATNMAKVFLILLVVYFSVPLALVYFNKRMYYADHLLVSLEACSLIVLVVFSAVPWLMRLVVLIASWTGRNWSFVLSDREGSLISMGVLMYLFYQLGKRAYAEQGWRAAVKAALLILGFFVMLQLYRASLFFITLWSL